MTFCKTSLKILVAGVVLAFAAKEEEQCDSFSTLQQGATRQTALAGDSKPLVKTPFMMSHDSASFSMSDMGYADICMDYQTQTVNFENQLNCGARAFDLRMEQAADGWRFYHGPKPGDFLNYHFQIKPEDALEQFNGWAKTHQDQLIILVFSHTQKNNRGDVTAMLKNAGIPYKDGGHNSKIGNMTFDQAMKFSTTRDGGHILGLFEMEIEANMKDPDAVTPWDYSALNNEIDIQLGKNDRIKEYFIEYQGIWQLSNKRAIMQALFHSAEKCKGTLLCNAHADDGKGLNTYMARTYGDKAKAAGGLWLADNLCGGGKDLAAKLGTTVSADDAAKCDNACNNAPKKCPWR